MESDHKVVPQRVLTGVISLMSTINKRTMMTPTHEICHFSILSFFFLFMPVIRAPTGMNVVSWSLNVLRFASGRSVRHFMRRLAPSRNRRASMPRFHHVTYFAITGTPTFHSLNFPFMCTNELIVR